MVHFKKSKLFFSQQYKLDEMKHKKSVSLFRLYPACGLWTARGQDKLKTAHTFRDTMMRARRARRIKPKDCVAMFRP